ncbi:MAG: hypothetical protein K0R40_323 [Burkholderiales bacterium]|jgi:hypothetical protein|nr:hypothetical protein [Burkholderiales bacterium]
MRTVTSIALALGAAVTLGLGAAYAQEAAKPGAKPEAKQEEHRHGAEHRQGKQHRHGMQRMGGEMRGGCHEGEAAEHKHQS